MSGNLTTAHARIGCPHGGRATPAAGAPSGVLADGAPVATVTQIHTITGCRHTADGVPSPCVSVRWNPAAVRDSVLVDGVPVLLDTTDAQCFSAALVPQGPPRITAQPQGVVCR